MHILNEIQVIQHLFYIYLHFNEIFMDSGQCYKILHNNNIINLGI